MNLRNEQQSLDTTIPKLKKDYSLMLDLFSSDQDWKSICLAIAKEEPDIVAKYIVVKPKLTDAELQPYADIADAMPHKKIQAIKLCRQVTGWGLKQAKDCIDDMHSERIELATDKVKAFIDSYDSDDMDGF